MLPVLAQTKLMTVFDLLCIVLSRMRGLSTELRTVTWCRTRWLVLCCIYSAADGVYGYY